MGELMRKILILCLLSLSGCAAWSVITGLSVTPQSAVVAINTFDALETIATGYLRLPPCVSTGPVVCRQAVAVANIIPAVRTGRVARDEIVLLLKQNSGANIPVANFNTLQAVITTLQAVYAHYNVNQQ